MSRKFIVNKMYIWTLFVVFVSGYLVLALLFSACSLFDKKETVASSSNVISEVKAIPIQEQNHSKQDQTVKPATVRPTKIALILGPGGLRTYAHLGVLSEFEKARIPIKSIVGLEWGAWVGALYTSSGKSPEAEWKMMKLKKEHLPSKAFFAKGFVPQNVQTWETLLQDNFGSQIIEKGFMPFACPAQSFVSNRLTWQDRGEFARIVKRCMSYPPFFKPESHWVADPFALKESVDYLKAQGVTLIIFVNVMEGSFSNIREMEEEVSITLLLSQIKNHMQTAQSYVEDILTVNTGKIGLMSLEERHNLVQKGREAARAFIQKSSEKYSF